MGYNLTIGELKTDIYYDELYSRINNRAEVKRNDDAPAYGEPTDFTNMRWPSYTSWHNAMRFVGLEDLMYNKETGLILNHPGCTVLVPEHKEIIDEAYKNFYEKYPNAKAGYSPKINEKEGIFDDPDWPEENNYATRLEWLRYWVDWALVNCTIPVFHNS
jgi:hypothetical protein